MLRLFVCPVLSVLVLLALGAGPVSAALPRTYDLQRVDSPAPSTNGNFGRALAVVGDVNADGEQDLLVGNDKHGRQAGQVFVISGADGSMIRELQRPDTDIVGRGRASGFGAAVGKIGLNQDSGPFNDIGSCPLGDSGDPDAYCDAPTVGAPDGIPDLLVTASGVDVDPVTGAIDPSLNNDLGVAYVFDGRTGALLKKLLMPAVDRQMEVALDNDPRYGRAALSPNGLFPCIGHAGIGPCPALPAAVAAGDVDGGGAADILVAATDFDETPGNSHPLSPCATSVAAACPGSGRVYTYNGETIAGSDPTVVDETPDQTITDLYSKPDGGSRIGTTLTPVGDLGQCTTSPARSPAASVRTRRATWMARPTTSAPARISTPSGSTGPGSSFSWTATPGRSCASSTTPSRSRCRRWAWPRTGLSSPRSAISGRAPSGTSSCRRRTRTSAGRRSGARTCSTATSPVATTLNGLSLCDWLISFAVCLPLRRHERLRRRQDADGWDRRRRRVRLRHASSAVLPTASAARSQ